MTASRAALADSTRVHELLYKALCGRSTTVEGYAEGAVVFPDTPTTTRLPLSAPLRGADSAAWLKMAIAHRAFHEEAGSFRFASRRFEQMTGIRVDQREQGSDLGDFLAAFAQRHLAVQIFTLIEDMRIDAILIGRLGGLAAEYPAIAAAELDLRPAIENLPPRAAMLEILTRISLLQPPQTVPDDLAASARSMAATVAPVAAAGATVEDAAAASLKVYAMMSGLANLGHVGGGGSLQAPDPDNATSPLPWPARWPETARVALEGDDTLLVEDIPIGFRGSIEGFLWASPGAAGPNHQAVYHWAGVGDANTEIAGSAVRSPSQFPGPPEPLPHEHHDVSRPLHEREGGPLRPRGPRSYVYAEWDCERSAYRGQWCRVSEEQLGSADPRAVRAVEHRYAHLLGRLRRQMLVAAPGAFVISRRSRSGDEVDYDAALEAMIDRRSGAANSDAVYESLRRERRDVAVGILVDVSSSTAERVPGAEPLWSSPTLDHPTASARRPPRILDLEIISSLLCMAALDSVGDRFAAWTFSGTGRERVVVSVLKGFDEPFDGRVVSRAAAVKPMHATRMGAAIRHCTARMRMARANTNVLIVLSDGRPTDIDYGSEYGEEGSLRYALGDTARALAEARRAGVRPYLLTVDVTGEDYLGDLGSVDAEVLSDLNVLPERLTGLYRHLTDSGSKR